MITISTLLQSDDDDEEEEQTAWLMIQLGLDFSLGWISAEKWRVGYVPYTAMVVAILKQDSDHRKQFSEHAALQDHPQAKPEYEWDHQSMVFTKQHTRLWRKIFRVKHTPSSGTKICWSTTGAPISELHIEALNCKNYYGEGKLNELISYLIININLNT